ncbi:MAG: hypothetical protein RML37_04265 [Chitinophagales bacterium]|nr:hypothetical protein [Chitinophagales bacterium]
MSPSSRERIKNHKQSEHIFKVKKIDNILNTGTQLKGYERNDINGVGAGANINLNFSLNFRKQYKEILKNDEGGGGWIFLGVVGHELVHEDDIKRG